MWRSWRTSSAGVESRTRLGRFRWVAERTLAWLARFRRLAIRYERLEAMHQALLDLGCALICLNALHWPAQEGVKRPLLWQMHT